MITSKKKILLYILLIESSLVFRIDSGHRNHYSCTHIKYVPRWYIVRVAFTPDWSDFQFRIVRNDFLWIFFLFFFSLFATVVCEQHYKNSIEFSPKVDWNSIVNGIRVAHSTWLCIVSMENKKGKGED